MSQRLRWTELDQPARHQFKCWESSGLGSAAGWSSTWSRQIVDSLIFGEVGSLEQGEAPGQGDLNGAVTSSGLGRCRVSTLLFRLLHRRLMRQRQSRAMTGGLAMGRSRDERCASRSWRLYDVDGDVHLTGVCQNVGGAGESPSWLAVPNREQ